VVIGTAELSPITKSPMSPVSPRLSRDEYNWGTIIKMYEKQLKALRTERDELKAKTKI